jgi:hypothetical protein
MNNQNRIGFIASLPDLFKKNNRQHDLPEVLFNLVALIREDAPEDEHLIIDMFNLESDDKGIQQFAHFLLDTLLDRHGVQEPTVNQQSEDSLSFLFRQDRILKPSGVKRLVTYAESLEWLGEYNFGVRLLDYPHIQWPDSFTGQLQQRCQLSLAYHLFYQGNKARAFEVASKVDSKSLEPEWEEKRRYILGRSYQYQNDFDKAESFYRLPSPPTTEYGIRCQHQVAFRYCLDRSDFGKAAQLLEDILSRSYSFKTNLHESRLLLSTCQIRLGRYEEAQAPLIQLIQRRHEKIHSHKEATAGRALADLYLCSFQGERALVEIQSVISILERYPNQASHIYAMDIQSQILAYLFGDKEKALNIIDQSIVMARIEWQKHGHVASLSWNLQTKRILLALFRTRQNEIDLEEYESTRLKWSKYQEFRHDFIVILEQLFTANRKNKKNDDKLIQETKNLLNKAKENGWGWYPTVLGTIHAGLLKNVPLTPQTANSSEWQEWTKTYLFDQIFQALDFPLATSPQTIH